MNKVVEIMNSRNLKIIEPAEVPIHPLPRKRLIILVTFVILGGIIGLVLAFIVESVHKKLRKPMEIEKILGVPMIGMIPLFKDEDEKMDGEK
ncbi:MAG: hypothetical protein ACTH29_04325 [Fusobacterium sp.]